MIAVTSIFCLFFKYKVMSCRSDLKITVADDTKDRIVSKRMAA